MLLYFFLVCLFPLSFGGSAGNPERRSEPTYAVAVCQKWQLHLFLGYLQRFVQGRASEMSAVFRMLLVSHVPVESISGVHSAP
jgi:hypothetical protein